MNQRIIMLDFCFYLPAKLHHYSLLLYPIETNSKHKRSVDQLAAISFAATLSELVSVADC